MGPGATEREVYLRRVLTGEMACYCPEELAEAAGMFGAELYVGAGLWVEGWPYVLVKFERAGVGNYGQVWRVQPMFTLDKTFLLEIGPGDEVRVVGKPEPARARAA